ncbi:MAG: site-specific DNA-methyltransferase [Actinomycetota bacterium]|nr:site-specific DNA-methyltransferase [Actinomycetota bacterium]
MPERFNLAPPVVVAEKTRELGRLFPEVVTEGGLIDFDRLRLALGDDLDVGKERYGMSWPGKADCFRTIQAPSLATLRPAPGESVGFDSTENLIIEGDNLEVLKLMQKSYLGKIKMIYIDPPYNTGNDFIYPDDYAESLKTYLQYTGQVDAEGTRFSTNTDRTGRFHSNWLRMMYPRLYLARNLLKEEGVLLVSIDDAELDNLRKLGSEVFGEENLVAALVWEKGRKNDAKLFSVGHEYMLVYAKSLEKLREVDTVWREEKPGAREIWEEYLRLRAAHGDSDEAVEKEIQRWFQSLPNSHPSKKWSRYRRIDEHGPWRDRDISWPGGDGPTYDVIHPITGQPCRVPERGWIYSSPAEMQRQIRLGLVVFRDDHTQPPFRKAHIRPIRQELEGEPDESAAGHEEAELATQVRGSYFYKQSQVAVKYLRGLMGAKVFDNPKDHEEIAKLLDYILGDSRGELILDFFAGSGTTGEAVLRLNKSRGSQHRFILVQLPEPCDASSRSGKAALDMSLATIADITKERVRRVIDRLNEEDSRNLEAAAAGLPDRGFRVFKLAESNFQTWDASAATDEEALSEQLDLHVAHIREGRSDEDLLYEILLKSGFPLTTSVEEIKCADAVVHSIADGALFICLERNLSLDAIRAMAELKPHRVVCLDEGFAENDQLKANAVQIFKTKDVPSFKTV